MSGTVVMDNDFQQQQIMNALNVALRRCKIGKVVRKAKPFDGFALPREWYPTPDMKPFDVRFDYVSNIGLGF